MHNNNGFGFLSVPNEIIDGKILEVYQRLRKLLITHRKVTTTPSKSKWIKELNKAMKGGKDFEPIPIQHLFEALEYLEKNITSQYCPHVHSAISFCQKINQLKNLYDKHHE